VCSDESKVDFENNFGGIDGRSGRYRVRVQKLESDHAEVAETARSSYQRGELGLLQSPHLRAPRPCRTSLVLELTRLWSCVGRWLHDVRLHLPSAEAGRLGTDASCQAHVRSHRSRAVRPAPVHPVQRQRYRVLLRHE